MAGQPGQELRGGRANATEHCQRRGADRGPPQGGQAVRAAAPHGLPPPHDLLWPTEAAFWALWPHRARATNTAFCRGPSQSKCSSTYQLGTGLQGPYFFHF